MSEVSTQQAQITTMTVEIRALTINGKQMTLSVFKQLPRGSYIEQRYNEKTHEYDFEFAPKGYPWGYVNYHPDRVCRIISPHTHLVWQWHGKLYRDSVDQDCVKELDRLFTLDQLFIAV